MTVMRGLTRALFTVAVTGCMGFGVASAWSQTAEDTFKGKTITVTIGFAPGGNYDFVGRLVARHIGKHLPGNPAGVAVNTPGAGSIRAANYLSATAPKDGTALGILSSAIAIEEALGTSGIAYKSAEFNWVGRVSLILQVLATLDPAKAKTIEDVMKIDTPVGGTGAGSPSEGYPKLLNGVLGTKFKVISGYRSSADTMLAMERGEIDGSLPSWNTIKRTKADWIVANKIHPLVQWVLERHPDLPDTPTSVELGKTQADRDVLTFYTSGEELGRSIMAPPDMAPDRVKLIRGAFDAMLKDKDFLDEVEKTRLEFNPLSGEKLQQIVVDTAKTPRAIIERARALLGAD
jgi:tripartite-type tricarboxylate transporter receptor subunit TctC